MSRNLYILLSLLLLSPMISAEKRAVDACFVAAPSAVLPHLDENARRDLLDFYDAGQENRSTNRLGARPRIESLDDRQITLRLSSFSTLQIALFPARDSGAVIVTIETVELPARDSRIAFYDDRWLPLENKTIFTPPTAEKFMGKISKKERKQAVALIDILPVFYTVTGDTLRAEESLDKYLPEEIYARIAPSLSGRPLVYRWDKMRFIP